MPRRRHLLALVAAVVVGIGASLYVSSQSAVAAAGCSRPAPTTAAGYQAMFDAKRDSTWSGGDQAASVALPSGQELWLFGDTLRGDRVVHNSALVQDGDCLTALAATDELIPSRPDGQWYWPQSAVVVGRSLVVFCGRVERTGPGAFGFRTTGVDAAVFDLSSGLPRFSRMLRTPSSDSPETSFQYGAASAHDGDWLYVWGSRKVSGAFGRQVSVARTHAVDGSWEFWDGAGWSSSPGAAAPIADGWSTAFSVWRSGGAWHGLTKLDDVFGKSVAASVSPSVTGAFRDRVLFDAASGSVLLYNALAHPEIRLAGGQLLVTVCRNSADLHRVLVERDLYKPQFHAVRV